MSLEELLGFIAFAAIFYGIVVFAEWIGKKVEKDQS